MREVIIVRRDFFHRRRRRSCSAALSWSISCLASLIISAFFSTVLLGFAESVTHLRVNKDTDLIEHVHDSAFTLQRPFDLVALLNQIERSYRVDKIKALITSIESVDNFNTCKT